MSDAVEKVARTWASMDGKPYGEGYVEDAAFLLRRSGVGRRIEELEAKLAKARVEGFWAGRACGGSKKAIDTALAKLLKRQDDE